MSLTSHCSLVVRNYDYTERKESTSLSHPVGTVISLLPIQYPTDNLKTPLQVFATLCMVTDDQKYTWSHILWPTTSAKLATAQNSTMLSTLRHDTNTIYVLHDWQSTTWYKILYAMEQLIINWQCFWKPFTCIHSKPNSTSRCRAWQYTLLQA